MDRVDAERLRVTQWRQCACKQPSARLGYGVSAYTVYRQRPQGSLPGTKTKGATTSISPFSNTHEGGAGIGDASVTICCATARKKGEPECSVILCRNRLPLASRTKATLTIPRKFRTRASSGNVLNRAIWCSTWLTHRFCSACSCGLGPLWHPASTATIKARAGIKLRMRSHFP